MDWFERLKLMKSKSNKTTKEISELSNIPEPTLEKLFAGNTKDPRLNTVWAVVHCMGYTLDDLIPGDEKREKAPSGLEDEALQIAERYANLDDIGKGAVEAILNYEESRIKPFLVFAARKSDAPHAPTGPDTDVDI